MNIILRWFAAVFVPITVLSCGVQVARAADNTTVMHASLNATPDPRTTAAGAESTATLTAT